MSGPNTAGLVMCHTAIIAGVAWVCVSTVAISGEAEWPHLRGPNYDAVSTETNLIESCPTGGPPILWRIDLGQGYSGFIAVNGKLYTQMQSSSGQYVVCIDAENGQTLWQHRYGAPWQAEGDYPGPYATPTHHEGRIYFAGTDGLIGCLNSENGRSIWSLNVVQKFRGRGVDFGYACSPLVEDGKVIVPVGGVGASVVALDARDGSVVWKSGDEPASYCSAYPISLGGQRQVVTFLQNALVAFDLKTGRQLWDRRGSEGYDEHAALPLYQEPHLLIFAPFHAGAKLLRLNQQGTGCAAELVWENKEISNDILSSVLINGQVYGFDIRDFQANEEAPSKGQFKCMDLATGKVRWATDRTGHSSVIAADGKLILLNDTGAMIIVRATPDAYEELCRVQIFNEGLCWTAPTLYRGKLYLRNQHEAVCVDLRREAGAGLRAANRFETRPSASRWSIWKQGFFDAPSVRELAVWYLACLVGVFGVASAAWLRGGSQRAFWVVAFVLGGVGIICGSALSGSLIFTWPASLFVTYHLALQTADKAQRAPREFRRASFGTSLLFLAVCALYFYLCKTLFLVMGWGFFAGFVTAWPMSVHASRKLAVDARPGPFLLRVACAFTIYFWTSGAFTIWRLSRGL